MPPILFLGLLAAMSTLSLSIHVQSIPVITESFGATYAEAQLTVSAYILTFACAQLIVGPLSDRVGRKPVLYGGLMLFGLASAGAAMAINIEMLVAARLTQGAGACAMLVVARAVVQDTHRGLDAARVMAFVAMLQSAGPPIAPIVGGTIDVLLDWRWIFWFLTFFAGFLALASAFWLRETRPLTGGKADSWGTIFLRYAQLFRSRRYVGYTITFTFGTSAFLGYFAVGPALLIETRGFTPIMFSVTLTMIASQFIVGNYVAIWVVRRYGLDRTLLVGALGQSLAGIILILFSGETHIAAVVLPMMVFALFNGFVFANGIAGATSIDPRVAGSAASFLGFCQLGTGATLAFLMSQLTNDTIVPYAVVLILFGIVGASGMLLARASEPASA